MPGRSRTLILAAVNPAGDHTSAIDLVRQFDDKFLGVLLQLHGLLD
jgi:hypothetical protein